MKNFATILALVVAMAPSLALADDAFTREDAHREITKRFGGEVNASATTGQVLTKQANGSLAFATIAPGVTSITGTANQITASSSTGAITLSLPQNIHTGASPTFAGLTLSGSQAQNAVFAAPSGSAGAPTFRVLAAADIPSLNASKITAGTLPEARGGTNQSTYTRGDILVASAADTLSKVTIGSANKVLHSDGTDATWQALVAADIPSLAASKITTGQLSLARGGTGLDGSGVTDGQIPIGQTSDNTLGYAAITGTANRVTVTNAGHSITLSGPQDLASGSSPAFTGLTLSGNLESDGTIGLGASGTADTILARDASDQFAQRRGTTAQRFSVYNTFTSTNVFERLTLDWSTANYARIYPDYGSSGGSPRAMIINGSTLTTDVAAPVDTYRTWSAWGNAAVNTGGAGVTIQSGFGARSFTISNFANLQSNANTFSFALSHGFSQTFTAGVDFQAVTSNAQTAVNFAAAVNASSPINGILLAVASSNVVYFQPIGNAWLWATFSTNAAGANATANIGADGGMFLVGGGNATLGNPLLILRPNSLLVGASAFGNIANAACGGFGITSGNSNGNAAPVPVTIQGAPAVLGGASGSAANAAVTLLSLNAVQNNLTGTNNLATLSATFANGGSASNSTLNRLDYGQMTLNYTGGTKTDAITMFGRDLVETGDPSGTINLFDFRAGVAGTTSKFRVDNGGNLTAAGSLNAGTNVITGSGSSRLGWGSSTQMTAATDSTVQFANNAATGFSTLYLGLKTPTGTDTAGQTTLIASGASTGAGTGSTFGLQVSPAVSSGASGSGVNALTTGLLLSGVQNNLTSASFAAGTFLNLANVTFGDGAAAGTGSFAGVSITPTLNYTNGTRAQNFTALLINQTNTSAPTGTLNLIDLQLAGTSKFSVDSTGLTSCAGIFVPTGEVRALNNVRAAAGNAIYWNGRAVMESPGDGQVRLRNAASSSFQGLILGPTAPTFPGTAPANGEVLTIGSAMESLTLSTSGTTTDTSANLLPAGAIILAVDCRVTTTITTATDWSVGDPTTSTRFSSANSTLTSGTTSIGLNHMAGNVTTAAAGPTQAAAAKVRITTTGTPGAGVIRITVHYVQLTAPTS